MKRIFIATLAVLLLTGTHNTALARYVMPSSGSSKSVLNPDTDGDGLPDSYDLCPRQNDAWFLVPTAWVGQDANGIEDADFLDLSTEIRATEDGESALDALKAAEALEDSYDECDYYYNEDCLNMDTITDVETDDVAETLGVITTLYLLDGGSQYVYDALINAKSTLTPKIKMQAANYGETYLYISFWSGEDVEWMINTHTNVAGVIQKDCSR